MAVATTVDELDIVRAYNEGLVKSAIAAKYHIGVRRVRMILDRNRGQILNGRSRIRVEKKLQVNSDVKSWGPEKPAIIQESEPSIVCKMVIAGCVFSELYHLCCCECAWRKRGKCRRESCCLQPGVCGNFRKRRGRH